MLMGARALLSRPGFGADVHFLLQVTPEQFQEAAGLLG